MFICPNRSIGLHRHDLVTEAKVCCGLLPASAPYPMVTHAAPVYTGPSERQLAYVKDLGGSVEFAKTLSREKASEYITELIAKKKEPAPVVVQPEPKKVDPRLEMLSSLIGNIPNGYFAVREQETDPLVFIRLSRPDRGKFKGCVKIQTQHSDVLELALVRYPSSARWYVYRGSVIDKMLLVCLDPSGAQLQYARELGHCCNCNKTLTDERSRHYGIGPECEKFRPEIIDRVDEMNDGKSYETLRAQSLV